MNEKKNNKTRKVKEKLVKLRSWDYDESIEKGGVKEDGKLKILQKKMEAR